MLNDNGYDSIKIVVADMFVGGTNDIISTMNSDSQFNSSFDIIGVHYPSSSEDTQNMAECGKVLWSSEDSSTNDDLIGGGCWGRLLNWNYIYGNYTSTTMWSIISSWYEYLPYFGDGLMNAAWPWNGYYEVKSPLWITAHTTQFVKTLESKWYYIKQGYGSGKLMNGGTYVSYISISDDNKLNITIVIETFDWDKSLCIRDNPPNFGNSTTQNIAFTITNSNDYILPTILYQFKTILFGAKTYQFESQPSIRLSNNSFTLYNVEPNAMITISSVSSAKKGSYPSPPNKAKFSLPYSDNFDSYNINDSNEPQAKYFSDQGGSFVIKQAIDKDSGNLAMEQVVPYSPSLNGTSWHSNTDPPQPLTIIGDYNLTDYTISVSAYMISNNQYYDNNTLNVGAWNTSNVMIGVRFGGTLSQSGCRGNPREYPCVEAMGNSFFDYGYLLQINDNGYWKLMPGAFNPILIDGNLNMDLTKIWFNVSLTIKEYSLSATFNNKTLFSNIPDPNKRWDTGFGGLSCGWQTVQWDNFLLL